MLFLNLELVILTSLAVTLIRLANPPVYSVSPESLDAMLFSNALPFKTSIVELMRIALSSNDRSWNCEFKTLTFSPVASMLEFFMNSQFLKVRFPPLNAIPELMNLQFSKIIFDSPFTIIAF